MKIKVNNKNESSIEMSISLSWKDIQQDYINQENEVLSNAKEKGARKGKLVGIQKDIFLKNNRDYINSTFDFFENS